MMDRPTYYIDIFAKAIRDELEGNLIPFWLERAVDSEHGGFIGQMSNEGKVDPQARKGLILNARLLWTYSALYRFNPEPQCRDMARRAYDYLEKYFWDSKFGGVFWLLDCNGNALETEKKIYGQAFYIYALAEYFLAFSGQPALERAVEMFNLIESHSYDNEFGGYFEVCNRDFSIAAGGRLSEKDMAEKKSMNNHLHVIEAYTNLYRIWPDEKLKARLAELLDLFAKHIIDSDTGHMNHFFDESWQVKSQSYTFGHDIEASWLLCEAAEVLGDANLISQVRQLALRLARVTMAEGLDTDGGMCYEGRGGQIIDPNREWWPQAESVVGFLNAYQLSHDESFMAAAKKAWDYLIKYIADHEHGGWFWRVDPAGRPDPKEPKVSQWKGPYHSVRMCLEAIRRLKLIAESKDK
jgi:mannobiose 2-epimerase